MVQITRFAPEEGEEKMPLVIAMPGFVSPLEGGRTESILEELRDNGVLGYNLRFSDITQDGNTVTCRFDLDHYIRDLTDCIDMAVRDRRFDGKNLGIFASSISGCIFGYSLAQHSLALAPKSHVSVSPLLGWKYFANEQTRKALHNAPYIPLSSPSDREKGINRFVPADSIPGLEQIDALEALHNHYKPQGMKVMTLLGRNDKTSDPESIRDYHRSLGGDSSGLVEYDSDHAIPNSDSQPLIVEFLQRTLREAA